MARIIISAIMYVVGFTATAFAQEDHSCLIPPNQYRFNSLDKMPSTVSASLQKLMPGIKPSMAGCQIKQGTSCFYAGAEYGNRWVAVVAVGGQNERRVPLVFMYENGMQAAQQMMGSTAGVPVCALNRLAGNRPRKPSLKERLAAAAAMKNKPIGPPQSH